MLALWIGMAKARKQQAKSSGQLRVIAGVHRGRKLPVLDLQGLRPTTDRQKETLFNWLMMDVNGSVCLDLFAGAGSLGIEALSRGARQTLFVEKNKAAASNIQQNLVLLKYENSQAKVFHNDAFTVLSGELSNSVFDIVFIDPPFNASLVQRSIDMINEHITLAQGAKIYVECEHTAANFSVPTHWSLIKQSKSQQSCAQLFQAD
jgi:16S rRNA (guanine966-N2)-methyltransferase